MASQPTPANQRTRVITWASPQQDILFKIQVDTKIEKNKEAAYGQTYKELTGLDDGYGVYFLCYRSPADQIGLEDWYFICGFERQFLYNFEQAYPWGGLNDFPRISRTFVYFRNTYSPIPNGTSDPVNTDAILISQVQKRIGQENLDSLFVVTTQTYDVVAEASDQTGFGYQVSYPWQDDNYPMVTWKFTIKAVNYAPLPELSLCPIPGYETLKLTEQPNSEITEDQDQEIIVTRVYQTLPGPALVKNRLERDTKVPQQFIVAATVTATTTRIEAPTATPDALTGVIESSEIQPDGKATSSKVTTTYDEVSTSPLTGSDIDPETGKSFSYTVQHVPAGTVSTLPVDANGIGIIIKPLNTYWSIQTVRKIVGLAGNTRTYRKLMNFYWPKVITSLNFQAITDRDDNIVKTVQWVGIGSRDPYKGSCTCTVTDSWSLNAPTVSVPTQMMPKPMQWDMIFSNGSYEESLHPTIQVYETSGTEHPDYAYFVNTATFPATNYTDWPETVVAIDEVTPHFGGYLRTVIVVDRPNLGV